MSREIMQQAFDAFEDLKAFATDNGAMPENWDAYYPKQYDALEALRQELAKPDRKYPNHETYCGTCGACTYKPWVGLTDEEIEKGYETTGHYQTLRPQDRFAVFALARAIESRLKEKNNG